MASSEKEGPLFPEPGPKWMREPRLRKKEMKNGRVSLACQSGPLAESVHRQVHVMRAVPPASSSCRIDEMLQLFKTERNWGRLRVKAVPICVICPLKLGSVKFGATFE